MAPVWKRIAETAGLNTKKIELYVKSHLSSKHNSMRLARPKVFIAQFLGIL